MTVSPPELALANSRNAFMMSLSSGILLCWSDAKPSLATSGHPGGPTLPLSRPRAHTLQQRDARRGAETSGGSRGPANGTRSAAAAELGREIFTAARV